MLKFHIHRTLVCPKGFTFTTLKWNPLVQLQFLKFEFCTTSCSFVVPYLINNCGFSQENPLKASLRLRFRGPQMPDSVLSFFRSHGFSNSQICHILQRTPQLLLCNTQKTLLPKFQFLLSKRVSSLDIVRMVTITPRFLGRSLENHIVPQYEFVRGFLQSDKRMIHLLIRCPNLLDESMLIPNIKLLLDNGVTHSNIVLLLQRQNHLLWSANLLNTVEELKQMGFDPSTSTFSVALLAKRTVGKTKWAEKIDTFKKWGWSQEQVLLAFRRQPQCMLSSRDKMNAVMSFWVEQVGFNSAEIVKATGIFLLSLHKRIAPRASVVQFLISKGRLQKEASLTTPFVLTEKLFLEKYVKHFKEDSSHLLKLYEEKMSLENVRDNSCS